MLVATSGQAQTLAGMRDMIWSTNVRSKDLRDAKRAAAKKISQGQSQSGHAARASLSPQSRRTKEINNSRGNKTQSRSGNRSGIATAHATAPAVPRQMQYSRQSNIPRNSVCSTEGSAGRTASTIFHRQKLPCLARLSPEPSPEMSASCTTPDNQLKALQVGLDFSQPCPGLRSGGSRQPPSFQPWQRCRRFSSWLAL